MLRTLSQSKEQSCFDGSALKAVVSVLTALCPDPIVGLLHCMAEWELAQLSDVKLARESVHEAELQRRRLTWKQAHRKASQRWHPDKFMGRFGSCIPTSQRHAVHAQVLGICQAVNSEWVVHLQSGGLKRGWNTRHTD